MVIKRGIPVSPGIAIASALVLDNEGFSIPQRFVEGNQDDGEMVRLRAALAAAAEEARASQTAIMAGVLESPAVVGVGKFLTNVSGGDEVIVDGTRGVLILNPDDETRTRFEETRKTFFTFEHGLTGLRDLPAETCDGV